ncbi:hypothetical protein B1H18_23485 [Streptomyces tsukubensis]|uniref:Uncharacterized protein n=1 Tax=Streptomyces tsukubensis TaxID=83656 RepID=A0A1V4A3W7_9ACTN|nr:hypothetical protein B1H18_23485 [Streptomyces tsukubensis]
MEQAGQRVARRLPQRTSSSPAGSLLEPKWSRISPVALSSRVRCPVRRIGWAQPPSPAIWCARGARWPVAASFASLAVSRARRSSADRPAAEAVTSAGQVCVVNADDGSETAGAVAEYGS